MKSLTADDVLALCETLRACGITASIKLLHRDDGKDRFEVALFAEDNPAAGSWFGTTLPVSYSLLAAAQAISRAVQTYVFHHGAVNRGKPIESDELKKAMGESDE